MYNFEPYAITRGAQLTIVGAYRALQNPSLLTSKHYKQVAIALLTGIALRILISIPVIVIKIILRIILFLLGLEYATWDEGLTNGVGFLQNYVLQVPFFLMTLMRYITPTSDYIFMESLAWVDHTYFIKHSGQNPIDLRNGYYHNLCRYLTKDTSTRQRISMKIIIVPIMKYSKKAGLSLLIFMLSYTPAIGRFVLPAVSFYTFQNKIGFAPAVVIFGIGIFLPRMYLVIFLQSYFASRSLMRELLEPYFCRIRFTKEQKKNWFFDREGLLFGFGIGFYFLLRIPLLGVLIYGIAEASTAYLITKITDPPPPPDQSEGFAASQQHWTNKTDFFKLSIQEIDSRNGSDKRTSSPTSASSSTATTFENPPPYVNLKHR